MNILRFSFFFSPSDERQWVTVWLCAHWQHTYSHQRTREHTQNTIKRWNISQQCEQTDRQYVLIIVKNIYQKKKEEKEEERDKKGKRSHQWFVWKASIRRLVLKWPWTHTTHFHFEIVCIWICRIYTLRTFWHRRDKTRQSDCIGGNWMCDAILGKRNGNERFRCC